MEADICLETLWETFQHLGRGSDGARKQRGGGKRTWRERGIDKWGRVEGGERQGAIKNQRGQEVKVDTSGVKELEKKNKIDGKERKGGEEG